MRFRFLLGALVLAGAITACVQANIVSPVGTDGTANPSPPPNRSPIIKSLAAHRFSSEKVTLWLQASDPDCDPMSVTWSTTQGILSSTVGLNVDLTMGATSSTPTLATVLVNVSDGRGGSAQGSLNVQFGADGLPTMTQEATASQPTPDPCSTPTPSPVGADQSQPTPDGTVRITGRAYTPSGYWNGQGAPPEDPVPGATFVFVGAPSQAVYTTTTDTLGRISINLPPGQYVVWGQDVGRLKPAPYSGFQDVYPNHPVGYDKEKFHYRSSANFQANMVIEVFFH
jgi:hypothetical protein